MEFETGFQCPASGFCVTAMYDTETRMLTAEITEDVDEMILNGYPEEDRPTLEEGMRETEKWVKAITQRCNNLLDAEKKLRDADVIEWQLGRPSPLDLFLAGEIDEEKEYELMDTPAYDRTGVVPDYVIEELGI